MPNVEPIPPRFIIDWFGGPAVTLDLQASPTASDRYLLKYTPPFRSSMRNPAEEISPNHADLEQRIGASMREFAAREVEGGRGYRGREVGNAGLRKLESLGKQLFRMVVPRNVEIDMRRLSLFLEIGTDERLLQYPWEIMHDGDNFLCLKHYIGRFVNLAKPLHVGGMFSYGPGSAIEDLSELGELRVLIVSVPVFDRSSSPAMPRGSHPSSTPSSINSFISSTSPVTRGSTRETWRRARSCYTTTT
jgi:hypothetical protein